MKRRPAPTMCGAMQAWPLEKAFQWIEPGPVALVTTAHRGRMNVMTLSWHLVMDFTPRIGVIIGPWDYTYRALRATRECVLAIPAVDLAEKAVEIGNCSGKEVDKFRKFRLTPLPARRVRAPLIAECLAHIECRVVNLRLVKSSSLFVLQGVQAWHDPGRRERRTFHANGDGTFVVDGRTLNLRSRMVKWFPE
jgi:flavin reductase (DIM6/NTAB) family NADH-FMN oxidoreductase RutF